MSAASAAKTTAAIRSTRVRGPSGIQNPFRFSPSAEAVRRKLIEQVAAAQGSRRGEGVALRRTFLLLDKASSKQTQRGRRARGREARAPRADILRRRKTVADIFNER